MIGNIPDAPSMVFFFLEDKGLKLTSFSRMLEKPFKVKKMYSIRNL